MIKTAVVILNWNGRAMLEQFLPSVVCHTSRPGVEIIVADNGSQDDSMRLLEERYPAIRRICLPRNYGFAEGYNQALQEVEATYYLLLNSDVEVTAGWLEPLEAVLDADPTRAAVMPKIRSYGDKNRFEYAGACGGFIDWLGYPFCRGRVLQEVEEDRGQYDEAREIFWATGACMLVRAALYQRMGGFDGDFFAHQEEIDLCWRFRLAGYSIRVEPRSVVYHVGGGTLPAKNPRKTFLNFRNNLAMLYKNLSPRSLWGTLALRLCLDGFSALVYLCEGNPRLFSAVWKAHRAFFRQHKSLRQKRKTIQRERIHSPGEIYRGSIVWRYYTGRKTTPIH